MRGDVDAALAFYRALGFRLAARWGPPFASVKRKGLSLWLAGPGSLGEVADALAVDALAARPAEDLHGARRRTLEAEHES